MWTAGDIALTIESLHGATPPTPSVADIFYVAFYPAAYLALALLLRRESSRLVPATWLDGAVAGLGAAALCAAFAFQSIVHLAGGGAGGRRRPSSPIRSATCCCSRWPSAAACWSRARAGGAWRLVALGLCDQRLRRHLDLFIGQPTTHLGGDRRRDRVADRAHAHVGRGVGAPRPPRRARPPAGARIPAAGARSGRGARDPAVGQHASASTRSPSAWRRRRSSSSASGSASRSAACAALTEERHRQARHRPADRPRQPPPARRRCSTRFFADHADPAPTAAAWRSCSSTSITSRRSTTRSGIRPATSCSPRSGRASSSCLRADRPARADRRRRARGRPASTRTPHARGARRRPAGGDARRRRSRSTW